MSASLQALKFWYTPAKFGLYRIFEQENALFAWNTCHFSFPFCTCQPARWFRCIIGFRSFETWHVTAGEAGRQDIHGIRGGYLLIIVFCSSQQNVCCLPKREYVYMNIWVCFICFHILQIGTGFKDEDLEQYYSFFKVKWHNMTSPLHTKSMTTQTLLPSHWWFHFIVL